MKTLRKKTMRVPALFVFINPIAGDDDGVLFADAGVWFLVFVPYSSFDMATSWSFIVWKPVVKTYKRNKLVRLIRKKQTNKP